MKISYKPRLSGLCSIYGAKHREFRFLRVYLQKCLGQRSQAEQKRRVKKIGKVLGGQKDGVICFNGGFLQERPEFRNFLVERKGEEYICTPLNESGTTLTQPQ